LQNIIKNNLWKVSRRRARYRDPSRPRLQKTGLETGTKSRDSITVMHVLPLAKHSTLNLKRFRQIDNVQYNSHTAPCTVSGADPRRAIETPKTYKSNFFHHDFVQFGKQHSRYKAILLSIVLSQQFYEVYFISLTVAKLL